MTRPNDLKKPIKMWRKNPYRMTVEERQKLISKLGFFNNYKKFGSVDLQGSCRKREIERLLGDSINVFNVESNHNCAGREFIEFITEIGYKDEPTVDKDGKPLSIRSTPVHTGACHEKFYYVGELIKIYDKFDVNYCNKSGLTHFHAACMSGCHGVVERFLELGQDPNCIAQIGSATPPPLH
uniref:Uncharacterized protein n=1 Tax=Trichogramma kaykai TaxID=54128 RepID=A0ABD2VUH3_9HYME